MFIYSVKASTLKFAAIVVVAIAVFTALFILIPPYGEEPAQSEVMSVSYTQIKTNDDRRAFLSSLGYEVSEAPVESASVKIPSEFDKIYAGYNEMQKSQGFDLSKYKNKEVERYTYTVNNYGGYEGTVYANLLIYRGKVVGGDICSADADGFVHGFEKT